MKLHIHPVSTTSHPNAIADGLEASLAGTPFVSI